MVKVRKESFTRLVGVTELARSTGYSVCHISLVLRGERVPSRTLARLLPPGPEDPQARHR